MIKNWFEIGDKNIKWRGLERPQTKVKVKQKILMVKLSCKNTNLLVSCKILVVQVACKNTIG